MVESVVSDLRAAGVSATGVIRENSLGHITAAILQAAQECDARLIMLGSSRRTDLPRIPLGSVSHRAEGPCAAAPESLLRKSVR